MTLSASSQHAPPARSSTHALRLRLDHLRALVPLHYKSSVGLLPDATGERVEDAEGLGERGRHACDGVGEAAVVGGAVQEQLLVVVEGDVGEVERRQQGAPGSSQELPTCSRSRSPPARTRCRRSPWPFLLLAL
jgi:hypothetical protein